MQANKIQAQRGTLIAMMLGVAVPGVLLHAQLDPIPFCSMKIVLNQTTDPGLGFCETSYMRCDSGYSCEPGTDYADCGDAAFVEGWCQKFIGGWTDPDTGECRFGTPSGPPTSTTILGFVDMKSCGGGVH